MLRTCCCRICGGFLRRTIQKELSKCNFSDISILAPWQSSKLTASEFPNRTGGRGNPEVAKNDQNGIETHFCSQVGNYHWIPRHTKLPGPGVKNDIESLAWGAQLNWPVVLGLVLAMMDIYDVSPGVIIIFITIAPFWGTIVGFDKMILCSHIHIVIQRLLGESFPRSPSLRKNFLRPGERFL